MSVLVSPSIEVKRRRKKLEGKIKALALQSA